MSISLQLFIELLALLGGVGGVYLAMSTRITRLEAQVEHLEATTEKQNDIINDKIDALTEAVNRLSVSMENKQNRS